MSNLLSSLCVLTISSLAVPSYAGQFPQSAPAAPAAPAAAPASVPETTTSDRREAMNDQQDWHFIGHVEMDRDPQGLSKIYADDVWLYMGQDRGVATGNVLLTQGANRISAEHAEFNTKDNLGTFYNAWGMATVKPQVQRPMTGGLALPPVIGQETVIMFFGEKIEKIGPKKYKITNGGFSTCAQPTPRWDLHAGTVTLNLDHYTVLTNAVMNVKGVPMFYLPVLYYPTKREDRATGFLIPTYGVSSLRGQSLHNAFFWAIDRSQDATFMHDWFSKTGQGYSSEYRYNYGLGTDGNFRVHVDDTHATSYPQSDGTVTTIDASRTFEIRGAANQKLPGNIRARGSANYFSSIQASQAFNTNIYDISRNQRTFGGNVIGAWSTYTLNATIDHSEYFNTTTTSSVSGNWPRMTFSRNERPIGGSPAYFSVSTDYSNFLRESRQAASASTPEVTTDFGLSRFDFAPQIRYPFKRWLWFTVNNTLSWHETYYTRTYALDADGKSTGVVVDAPLTRPALTYQAQIVGPVFNRVWDTPANGYAEKFKHTIEPYLTLNRTATIGDFARIVQSDGIDNLVTGVSYNYGLNNRFYAKRPLAPGQPAVAREIVDVTVSQTYYSDERQSLYDRQYQTSTLSGNVPSHFSPIALGIRGMPTNTFNATVNAEFDSRYLELRTISAQAGVTSGILQASLGWSKRAFIAQLPGFNDPNTLDHSINGTSNLRTRDNKYGLQYSFAYDVTHHGITTQRITGFYNAQCCGLAMEYQAYNYIGTAINSPIPADHRFFMSFTLAGLGNFSPFNGALSGVPR
ncbi:MAG TPA: putative LPS assembly protein LptD [Vicinamibacterales bacterium]|nr:putative LPS assembly protein LptD [Vicinamibacterales bacterium]